MKVLGPKLSQATGILAKVSSGRIVLVFDALNELDSGLSRSLTWLPSVLPAGCQYVFSTIDVPED